MGMRRFTRLANGSLPQLRRVRAVGIVGTGGEGGIRTLGTGVSPYNGLANRRIRPLCHLSGRRRTAGSGKLCAEIALYIERSGGGLERQ
jgi:hypothetical protein